MQNIKVSKDCYIPKDNIKLYIAYDSNAVRKDVRIKRKQGLIYDYTNGKKTMSVIYLKNGELVLTPVSVDIDTFSATFGSSIDAIIYFLENYLVKIHFDIIC